MIAHFFQREGVLFAGNHVVLDDESDDVLVTSLFLDFRVLLLLLDDLLSTAEDYIASNHDVPIGASRQETNQRRKSCETVDDSSLQVKIEAASVSIPQRRRRVIKRVNVGSQSGFANDVQLLKLSETGSLQWSQKQNRLMPKRRDLWE